MTPAHARLIYAARRELSYVKNDLRFWPVTGNAYAEMLAWQNALVELIEAVEKICQSPMTCMHGLHQVIATHSSTNCVFPILLMPTHHPKRRNGEVQKISHANATKTASGPSFS